MSAGGVWCPNGCGAVWDLAHGHKLHKCWGCGLAFDSESAGARPMMGPDEIECSRDDRGECDSCGFRHWRDQDDDGRACSDIGPWPCNECDAPVIYSPAFGWYWHVEAPECFLAGDPADYLARLVAAGLRRGADGFEHDAGGAVVDCGAPIIDRPVSS